MGLSKAMGDLWHSLVNRITGATKAVNKKIADPVVDGGIAIDDAKEDVRRYEQSIVELKKATKLLVIRQRAAEAEADKWDRIAKAEAEDVKAGKEGAKENLRKAAGEVKKARFKADSFKAEIAKNLSEEQRMIAERDAQEEKIDSAEANSAVFAARSQSAQIRAQSADSRNILHDSRGLAALDELQRKVEEAEAEATALEEVSGSANDDLEKKYANTATSAEVDELMDSYLK